MSTLHLHRSFFGLVYRKLSYGVVSGSEIPPCNKIDKPLVVYRFTGNLVTSITTLRRNDKIITFLRQKRDFNAFVI